MTVTYDALGRMVENNAGGSYTEFVYGPTGKKLATANGQTLIKAFVALPGGARAIYNSSGVLSYYRHSEWLGSSRLTSTASRALYSSTAYAPFGEQYKTAGTTDASFTGQDQDTVSSLYDFPARRQSPSQGRWISPDPAGRGAVSLTSPQSWNRYAYVNNNPLSFTDPLGLLMLCCGSGGGDDDDDSSGDDSSGGDPCFLYGIDCPPGGPSGPGGGGRGGNGHSTRNCNAQCQLKQAELNALIAVLTNSNCATLLDGGSGLAAAMLASAAFGSIASTWDINIAESVASNSGQTIPNAIAGTDPLIIQQGDGSQVNGAVTQIGSGFLGSGYANPITGAPRFGLNLSQNQTVTLLHEAGHALDFMDDGIANGSDTFIMPDNSTNLAAVSSVNSSIVANTCIGQGGNVPTMTSQVDGTIQ